MIAPTALPPQRLIVLYDSRCRLCVSARQWMERQPAFIDVSFMACDSPAARRHFGTLPWLGDQLVVVADDGRVWAGAAAFVMCFWALRRYRGLAGWLAAPQHWRLAAHLLNGVSARRGFLTAWLAPSHPGCAETCCEHQPEPRRGPYR